MSSDAEKKLWTWQCAMVDHIRLMVRLPSMLLAPATLTAKQMEAIQQSVSQVNDCNLSQIYREEASRVADLNGVYGLEVFAGYGRAFALTDGTGNTVEDLYSELVGVYSPAIARSTEAVAFFQLWMDMMGNTLLAFLRGTLTCAKRSEQNVLFELCFFLYYISVYIMMAFTVLALRGVKTGASPAVYKIFFIVSTLFAAAFIIPVGILGILTIPLYIFSGKESSPLPPRQQYIALSATSPGIGTYTVDLVKPVQDMKVGIRFGSNPSGQVIVTSVKKNSIASSTCIQIGDYVYSINGKNMPKGSPKTAAATLLGSSGVVTLVGAHADSTIANDEATV